MRILTRPNLGGPTRQAIALWHAQKKLGIGTLLVTGRVDGQEGVLRPADHGIEQLDFEAAMALGQAAEGWVELRDLGRGLHPLRDRRAQRQLGQLMGTYRPDVVHTHTSKAGFLGRRAALAQGVPTLVHTFHGHVLRDYFGRLVSRWLLRMERGLARRTDHLLAVSESCADELAELGVTARERLAIVPPAVEVATIYDRDEARRQLGIEASDRRVVAVGRFVPIKRLADFVATVALDPDLTGDLVGGGPERQQLLALANRSAKERINVRESVPAISALLPAYDALVLPSVREGCPLVAIEAFMAGIPVVGYDVPGVRDVLSHWGQGVLVPESMGPAGLLAAMHRLFASPELQRQCLDRSRAGLVRFAPASVARQLADIYAKK